MSNKPIIAQPHEIGEPYNIYNLPKVGDKVVTVDTSDECSLTLHGVYTVHKITSEGNRTYVRTNKEHGGWIIERFASYLPSQDSRPLTLVDIAEMMNDSYISLPLLFDGVPSGLCDKTIIDCGSDEIQQLFTCIDKYSVKIEPQEKWRAYKDTSEIPLEALNGWWRFKKKKYCGKIRAIYKTEVRFCGSEYGEKRMVNSLLRDGAQWLPDTLNPTTASEDEWQMAGVLE